CRGRPEGGPGDHGKADLVTFKRQEAVLAYAFLAPWIVGFLAFVAGPILASLYLSLTRYDIATPPRFLGVANYVQAFAVDPLFWSSLLRSFEYAAVVVPCGVGGALAVAMLLNHELRGTALYRTLYFLPHLTPTVAAVYIWSWLLSPRYGFVNEAL